MADWEAPASPPELGSNEVHVWLAPLTVSHTAFERLRRTLTEEERARAERLVFPEHRRRAIVSRGVLRAILGGYLERTADSLVFEYGPCGKPALGSCQDAAPDDIRFSLAHSGDRALYGFARRRELGVDLELVRSFPMARHVFERYSCPPERSAFGHRVTSPDQPRGFFTWWTRKEAVAKALGSGVSSALSLIDVSGRQALGVRAAGGLLRPASFEFYDLEPDAQLEAALAVEGPACRLSRWLWTAPGGAGALRAVDR